jgi:SAM-dependent methyltransferase
MSDFPKLKPLSKSLASFIFPRLGTVHGYSNPLGTLSSASCYSIFLRHLYILRAANVEKVPAVVAELGPGSSLGTGFAALIAGAEKYYALDLIDFSDLALNLAIFDELVALFRRRAPVPASGLHSLRFPDLDCYDFPEFLEIERGSAFDDRMAAIRDDIARKTGVFVAVAAPWTEASILAPNSVDWIFSQSVLEHIDDLATAYRVSARWLKPGGLASHLIDFGSHGLTREWNGHWALGDLAWSALRGRRPYLINRQPYAEHLRLAADNGFVTVLERRNKRFDGLIPEQFAPRFRGIGDEDARTRMALHVGRR